MVERGGCAVESPQPSDDETLFAAFLAMQHHAHIVVVLRSFKQAALGISAQRREHETEAAMHELGLTWEQWLEPDTAPDWDAVASRVLDELVPRFDTVIAPVLEPTGHEQHNAVAVLASAWPVDRRVCYLTYTRTHGRSRQGTEVVPEPQWIAAKHRALACYGSQMRPETGCQPWLLGDLREYVTP